MANPYTKPKRLPVPLAFSRNVSDCWHKSCFITGTGHLRPSITLHKPVIFTTVDHLKPKTP
jgi:hypothetical protein